MMIVIVGPTASGKSDLAMLLAEKLHGEIVCADSRTIYRGMDIGTAKPNKEDRAKVPHHLLDIAEPGEIMTVARFKSLAVSACRDIQSRGHLPILVGGSGLYIDSIIFDYQFPSEADESKRLKLEKLDDLALQEMLKLEDPAAYERVDLANRRRVVRAIETAGFSRSRSEEILPDTLVLGIRVSKEVAHDRIEKRTTLMLNKGFLEEVRIIGTTYGWDSSALNITGYGSFKDVVLGTKSAEQGAADMVAATMALYKKQMTWFKRNSAIKWLDGSSESSLYPAAEELVQNFIKAAQASR
jgi:tRNA dimethylallyltransferase